MSDMHNLKNSESIDMESVLERVGGDESFLQELLDIYIEDFMEKYALLEQAIAGGDFNNIKEIGHSLKGASGNLSLTYLHETAYRIELSGKENNIDQAKLMLVRLKEEFIKLKDLLPLEKRQIIEQKMPSMK
ncbi:MAG: Hpt domain-containing protein [Candidatus Aminicenantes bacterium]|nr:MAG: Hpt domain-containing protein [Candidatus Aminicenantes bacterium]